MRGSPLRNINTRFFFPGFESRVSNDENIDPRAAALRLNINKNKVVREH